MAGKAALTLRLLAVYDVHVPLSALVQSERWQALWCSLPVWLCVPHKSIKSFGIAEDGELHITLQKATQVRIAPTLPPVHVQTKCQLLTALLQHRNHGHMQASLALHSYHHVEEPAANLADGFVACASTLMLAEHTAAG